MESARFLIVGGGMTGDAAVKGIREHDADGSIILVGTERHPPYARPPLTKGLWSGDDEATRIVPPNRPTTALAIDRPRPAPPVRRLRERSTR